MHIAKTETVENPFYTNEEMDAVIEWVKANREQVEPEEQEVEDDADYESPRTRRRRSDGITNEQIAETFSAFLGLLKNFQTAAPQVTINPVLDVKLPTVTRITRVHRDKSGKLESTETEERPISE